jgi:hypothetical protein
MNPYECKISLRVTHPSIDPDVVSQTLSLQPATAWKADTQRVTPKQTPLSGVRTNSYWSQTLVDSSSCDLPAQLRLIVQNLAAFEDRFRIWRSEGATIELFIGWFGADRNFGDELPCTLLASLGQLGLDLSFDIYTAG